MRYVGAIAAAATAAVVTLSASPAAAAGERPEATGEVVVFSVDLMPLDRFPAPDTTCHKLPMATHVVANLTDQAVVVYGDPMCMVPMATLQPGTGAHSTGAGSFKLAQ